MVSPQPRETSDVNDQKKLNPIPDPEDLPIWGARAIGAHIGKSTKSTHYLLEKGALPAVKVAGVWTSTPGRLRKLFSGEAS